ncbi:hypothetical protein [Spongiibacter marinus]|uniref:hypothetical protein n=1 Tax=Spongiibacter marinus TaxID=354246 RepID=UPI0019609B66|nr:hypothetical protein [Spongiibacter marinus]MBM7424671.1 hypothetical protein [Spongiibacter marinus]
MPPRILYEETFDEDKVRYAEYTTTEKEVICEILLPNSTRKEQLIELLKQRKISSLIVKWGVCWAEYISIDGYNTHDLLSYDDFDESFSYEIEEVENMMGKLVPTMYGGNRLQRLKFDIKRGFITDFEIKFGPKLPKDYYGNYDYSMYPGGYGPSQAFYGDD